MVTNRSLWQDEPGIPGTIRSSPIHSIKDDQVLVKVYVRALNPCQDVAGTVAAVGATASQKFKLGDRVFGFSWNNGFREYVVLNYHAAAIIPESLSFAEASVFPLCVCTVSGGLFAKGFLAFPMPNPSASDIPAELKSTILIWGGSSSVRSNAIQLALAAGLDVYTTCSPRSIEYVTSLGVSKNKVFDYNSPTVTNTFASVLDSSSLPCAEIYLAAGKVSLICQVSHKSKQNIPVALSSPVLPGDTPGGVNVRMTYGAEGMMDMVRAVFGDRGFLPDLLGKGAV